MKSVSNEINNIIRKIFYQKDPILAEIIINWNQIVGTKFCIATNPVKITKNKDKGAIVNILHIHTNNSSLSMEMSFQQEVILERIAVYLGFKAVHRIRLIII